MSSRALVVLLVLLAGCGELARPFQPEERPAPAFDPLLPADSVGLGVSATDPALARAVVAALTAREVPAVVGESAGAALIESREGERALWELWAADGRLLARFALAESDASAVAERVLGVLTRARSERRLVVAPVAGIAASQALTTAMARALAGEGLVVVAAGEAPADALYVLGSVAATATGAGWATVELAWEVIAADGRRLGVVRQRNRVAAADLATGLAPLAPQIAAGGAAGVRDLLARLAAAQAPLSGQLSWR